MTNLENHQYSERVLARFKNPKNLSNVCPLEYKDIDIKNTDRNILVHFFVLIEQGSDSIVFKDIKFSSNIKDHYIAYIDAAIDLIRGRKLIDLPALRVKEVESYLRDSNVVEAFPGNEHHLFLYHDFLTNLQKVLAQEYFGNNSRTSPSLTRDYFPLKGSIHNPRRPLKELNPDEQEETLIKVIDVLIRPHLKKDLGDIQIIHFEDNMLVFNYLGNCRDCQNSLTSTFEYIQQVLRHELMAPEFLIVTDN